MVDNVTREDLDRLIEYLKQDNPRLTQGDQVKAFEKEWADWLGVKHAVFVNSGASANLITIAAVKEIFGDGEIIVPPLTWISDVASILHAGMSPVFVDINPKNLAMDVDLILKKITSKTRAVFLTHILGYNGLTGELLEELERRKIPLIEDVCESHGATFSGKKLGSFGYASNFSFYYAHHLSTIEGGMVCTNDEDFYQRILMYRSHGMVREAQSEEVRASYKALYSDLNPDFIFALRGYNLRSTELNAVIGRSGLKRLDENNSIRSENLNMFLDRLDPSKYETEFDRVGNSNYAFTLILKKPDLGFRDRVENALRAMKVEFRRGGSGGGNQLRQPYLQGCGIEWSPDDFPNIEHIHFYGYYIGNYPALPREKIETLCRVLNDLR